MKTNVFFSKQKGFSLVEILVALAISLFLIAGVLQIYVASRQSYRVQENLSRLQENGRFAADYVSRYIRLAGYRPRERLDQSRTSIFSIGPPDNRVIVGTHGATANDPDTITVRFLSDGAMQDCLGTTANNNTFAAYTLRVNTANNTLECAAVTNGVAQTQAIIEGVENMKILYGEERTPPGTPPLLRYVTFPNLNLNLSDVRSVRVTLLLSTLDNNLAETPQPFAFNGVTTTPADRRLRRVFTTTLTLRNWLP